MNEQDLLDAIAAQPNDDAPRLIFADWLEEHGDPRSDLIRLLIELTSSIDVADRAEKESRLLKLLEVCSGPVTAAHSSTLGARHVLIPPGEFLMGSPADEKDRDDNETQHRVKLTKPFYLGVHAVTQGDWKAVMGDEPWKGNEYVKEGSSYPATHVGWDDAVKFCAELTKRERGAGWIAAGESYRLPTEAEWEYACRAGTTAAYSFGNDASKTGDYAWFDENAWEVDAKYAHIVGLKKPNSWGLYDMHGNVMEWCSDFYGDYPNAYATDPERAPRVNRGGCWVSYAQYTRSAYRCSSLRWRRFNYLGFRVAFSPAS